MKIRILSVGKISASFLKDGIGEYTKRLKPYCDIFYDEIKEEPLGDKPSVAERQQAVEREGDRLLKRVKENEYMILLDLHGKMITSEELAVRFNQLSLTGKSHITFIIGGPFGVSDRLRQRAQEKLCLSPMTFTHQIVRLLLVEQIYRAFKIYRNEPYHW